MLDLSPVSDTKMCRETFKNFQISDFSSEFSDMCQKYQELRMLRRKEQLTFYILNVGLAEMTSIDKI